MANAIPKLDANGRIDTRVSDASTTRAGKVMLATDGEESATKAVAADDSRLDDARSDCTRIIACRRYRPDPVSDNKQRWARDSFASNDA